MEMEMEMKEVLEIHAGENGGVISNGGVSLALLPDPFGDATRNQGGLCNSRTARRIPAKVAFIHSSMI